MSVTFTRHAIERLKSRFSGSLSELTAIIEKGTLKHEATRTRNGRQVVEGQIRGRVARVIFVERSAGEFTIVTAMWSSKFNTSD